MAIGTARFTFTAGALIRKKFRREIDDYCFMTGVKADIKEDKGWLDSNFQITLEGEEDKINFLLKQLKEMERGLEK
jgi:hypothetical protein